jgi:hypothetical protein
MLQLELLIELFGILGLGRVRVQRLVGRAHDMVVFVWSAYLRLETLHLFLDVEQLDDIANHVDN